MTVQQLSNRHISILYRYGQRFFSQKLRPVGIEVGQMPAMMQIYHNPGITQEAISSNTGMDKGTTARSVKRLEKSGMIRREIDENDRRVNHIYSTKLAERYYPEIWQAVESLHGVLYRGFSEEEINTTVGLLRRMRENMALYMDTESTIKSLR